MIHDISKVKEKYDFVKICEEKRCLIFCDKINNNDVLIYNECGQCKKNSIKSVYMTTGIWFGFSTWACSYECVSYTGNTHYCAECKSELLSVNWVKYCEHCNGSGVGLNLVSLKEIPNGCTRCGGLGRFELFE